MGELEIIEKMQKILSSPKFWNKHYNALNIKGQVEDYNSPDAYSYCLMGALKKASGYDPLCLPKSRLYKLLLDEAGCPITHFNANRSYAEVMQLLLKVKKGLTE